MSPFDIISTNPRQVFGENCTANLLTAAKCENLVSLPTLFDKTNGLLENLPPQRQV
jgi:hypothetical protein